MWEESLSTHGSGWPCPRGLHEGGDCHSTFHPPRERNWVTSELPLDRRLEGMVLKVLVRDSPDPCSTPSELVFRDRAKALKQSPVCSLLITFTYMHASNLHVELRELVGVCSLLPLRGSWGSNSGLLVSLPMSHLCIPESIPVRQRQGPRPRPRLTQAPPR